MLPDREPSCAVAVDRVRVVLATSGQWRVCLWWRGLRQPLLYGPAFAARGGAVDYARAVAEWARTPDRAAWCLLWDGQRWVRRRR